jgi:two-component system, response regulator RegA
MKAEGQSLLIVDDDGVLRERLAQAFSERGFAVRVAEHYESALSQATADPPELALVDLKMPGRSGLDLIAALKKLDPETNIVVLTGYSSVTTALEAVRLGATHYLPKPANADEILGAFARAKGAAIEPVEITETPSLARAEWEHIDRVLADCAGNISEAARRLGLHRRSLQRKLQKRPPRT